MSISKEQEIPGRIFVFNPFTGEKETGRLLESGAFIGDDVDLGDRHHPSEFAARVMILGKSIVRNFCRVGEGTVINNAHLFNAKVGSGVTMQEGSAALGGDPFYSPSIGDNVEIREGAYIGFDSRIGARTTIGSKACVMYSSVGEDCVIEAGTGRSSDSGEYSDYYAMQAITKATGFSTQTTHIWYSQVGDNTSIGKDAVLYGTHIPAGSVLGTNSILRSAER